MALEEKEKNFERESRRMGPPPAANSRFSAAAEADRSNFRDRDEPRGPPPVANSRFAAAADADRSDFRRRDRDDEPRGPPPVANSRFAAAAAMAETEERNREDSRRDFRDRDENRGFGGRDDRGFGGRDDRGFGGRDDRGFGGRDDRGFGGRDDRGFGGRDDRGFGGRDDRGFGGRDDRGFGGRDDRGFGRNDQGPPPVANSRFAAAVAADGDYLDRGERDRRDRERMEERDMGGRNDGGGRFGGPRDGGYGRRGGRDDFRGGELQLPTGPRGSQEDDYDRPTITAPKKSAAVANLLKPKAPPVLDNVLKVPTKEQEDNMFKIPTKEEKKEEVKVEKKVEPTPPAPEPVPAPAVVDDTEVIAEFVSGKKQGEELKSWVEQQVIGKVEKLVFTLLEEKEKLNPDPECSWAEPSKYGAALVALVEDDVLKQMEVLFAIQKYCDKLGFPKLNEEYIVQSMFRAMYKYDLAADDAFDMWKEDESPEHDKGKMNAVIQTVDWFNWLEADDDDDDEEDYEEE